MTVAALEPSRALVTSRRFLSRSRLTVRALYWALRIAISPRAESAGVAREIESLGIGALVLVMGASILVGLIAIFQVAYQLEQYAAQAFSVRAIGWFAARELGPVVVAILVLTRTASSIAGELGAMSASTELDALRAMGLDPVKYLVAPRLLALLIALPCLTIISDALIGLGGWVGSTFFLRYNPAFFLEQMRSSFQLRDMAIGVGKSVVFAAIIAIVSADEGLSVAPEVGAAGRAASRAVVNALLLVLAADTVVNALFYFIPALVV